MTTFEWYSALVSVYSWVGLSVALLFPDTHMSHDRVPTFFLTCTAVSLPTSIFLTNLAHFLTHFPDALP